MSSSTVTFNSRRLTIATVLAMFGIGVPSLGLAITDLADEPLANATTTSILPNIALVIDDSGSMDEENLPDSGSTNRMLYCYKWYKYNALAYNPNLTYVPPIKADGTRFPNAIFTAALMDGYFANGAMMYDGNTTNTTIDLTKLVGVSGSNSTFAYVWMPDFGKSLQGRATSVKVTLLDNSVIELLGSPPVPGAGSNDEDVVGQAIADAINAKTSITGFSASYAVTNRKPSTGPYAGIQFFGLLTINAPASQYGLATPPVITLQKTAGSGTLPGVSAENFRSTTETIKGLYYSIANTPSSTTCDADIDYTRITSTTNIAAPGTTAGSAAALTNFANWFSYYRKRAFLMKAAVGEAFSRLKEDAYRIGLFTIDSIESGTDQSYGSPVNHDLAIDTFTGTTSGTHRAKWYDRLYGTHMAGYTPLRGALSRMGRMYAGKISGWDPVQYSCQRNFTILTTDGYWNTDAEVNPGYGPYQIDNSTLVGDQDGVYTMSGKTVVPGVTKPSYDGLHKQNTLADVAYYYYHTDLRTSALGNCTRTLSAGGTVDLCENNVPASGSKDNVDDVATHQHMTTFTLGLGVSGTLAYRTDYQTAQSGAYFNILQGSTNWPDPIANAGGERIDDLWHAAVNGRGKYFSARDPESLSQSLAATLLMIESVTGAGAAAATGSLQPTAGDPGSNRVYIASYQTKAWYGDVSAYTFDLTTGALPNSPDWQVGTLLDARITSANSDTRTIYVAVDGVRKSFSFGNLNSTQQGYFDTSKLSQYSTWTSTEKSTATGSSLVDYLRGQYAYEERDGNATKLYRARTHVLGDIVHSQPVYVKKMPNQFDASHDPTHGGRMGMLYVAANDGMLHAFCTEDSGACSQGKELWAYVIPPAMKNMWYVADEKQASSHHYIVDGPLSVADAYIGGSWKTVLVGGLGKGGRGYYAFDITDPTNPGLLWTFTADDAANMGFGYGPGIVTKVDANGDGVGSNSEWRVLLPSGHNNVPNLPTTGDYTSSDGGGYLFVVDAANGGLKQTIATGNGSKSSPSGLAFIQTQTPNFVTDNTSSYAYGGDLYGDMWRFDFANGNAKKIIGLGSTYPISTGAEIAQVEGSWALYFGTGRYLGRDDLSSMPSQLIVAVKAGASNLSLTDLTPQTGSATIDWTTGNGWYRTLSANERVHVSPQIYLGTLMFATVIPTASECRPGGSSRLYFMDYKSGSAIGSNSLYYEYASPLVGMSAVFLGSGKVFGITADGSKPTPKDFPVGSSANTTDASSGTRIMWRELID